MQHFSYKVINGITIYRIIAAPVLVVFIFTGDLGLFKWLLPLSFFTDAIDGFLARRYKVFSALGARLDSIGDDLTILAAIIGVFVFKMDFVKQHLVIIIVLIILLALQNILALIRYKKLSSFHVYSAKIAAVFQGLFLILLFLLPSAFNGLFYLAAATSFIDLVEEIILVIIMPDWRINVKGLYWILKEKKKN